MTRNVDTGSRIAAASFFAISLLRFDPFDFRKLARGLLLAPCLLVAASQLVVSFGVEGLPSDGLLERGKDRPVSIQFEANDTIVEQLEEFAAAVRGDGKPEVGGAYGTTSLAVIRSGIRSAREGRRVEVSEMLESD